LTLSRLRNVTLFIRAISSAKYRSGFIILSEQERIAMGPRVFVDAKILRRHEKTVPKNTIVSYVVEGENLSGFNRVRADRDRRSGIRSRILRDYEAERKILRVNDSHRSRIRIFPNQGEETKGW
jgi:hypothetical protein